MKRTHRKRRSFWIDMTFSIAIITLTVAAIYLISQASKKDTASSGGAAPTPITIDTIDSNYPGIKIIIETSNDPFSPFAIQYPQSKHSHFNDEISTYIKKAKQDYLVKMNDKKQKDNAKTGELNISFETLQFNSSHYSFVLLTNRYSGGENGSTEIRSFHLNPETGEVISIEDLFNHDLTNLEQIAPLVRDILYMDPALNGMLSSEDVERYTEPKWENYQNFALTDESLIFYFAENTVAADTAGPPIITIPLQEGNEWLADEFKLLDTTTDQVEMDDPVDNIDGNKENDPIPDNTDRQPVHNQDDSETDGTDIDHTDETDNVTDADTSTETVVKKVALTFDDGPDPKVTMQILDTLKKYDAKATFFMLGSRVEYYPEIAKHVADAGHELGNHTWTHPDLTKAGLDKIDKEIERTSSIIEEVTGIKSTSFRPPYGAVNSTVRSQTDLPVVLWDVDTLDWKHRNAEQLLVNVQNSVKDGSIILMHDIHQATADGLDAVLTYLQSEGFTFVTVSELD
ncbi:polysaccharide deacetylase family protein [Sporosarcina sp. ACRSM]|uniref:polysaccharide deacetylase family protein n=1 Tax=Sporosarcina sp. ACRSM TaxID=2918216 RepID=UPI001EF5A8D4|nr:polysaccharide deacetylase family protein [Sporosarcina sp. ACRSM]MCG7335463.1 polysaccharide deacetylase family protein [Sporosarcina sp. ACRSM]